MAKQQKKRKVLGILFPVLGTTLIVGGTVGCGAAYNLFGFQASSKDFEFWDAENKKWNDYESKLTPYSSETKYDEAGALQLYFDEIKDHKDILVDDFFVYYNGFFKEKISPYLALSNDGVAKGKVSVIDASSFPYVSLKLNLDISMTLETEKGKVQMIELLDIEASNIYFSMLWKEETHSISNWEFIPAAYAYYISKSKDMKKVKEILNKDNWYVKLNMEMVDGEETEKINKTFNSKNYLVEYKGEEGLDDDLDTALASIQIRLNYLKNLQLKEEK